MNNDPKQQGGMGQDDPMPTSPDPSSPGRTDVDPVREEESKSFLTTKVGVL